MNPSFFGLTGRVKPSVICDGRVISEGRWTRNLWLDRGLDQIAETAICDCFAVAVKGTGDDPTLEDLSGGSDTYSIADGTSTVTRTAGTRDFVAGDVGKLMRFSTSPFAEFTITAINSVSSVDVSPNASAAVSNKKIRLYSVQQTGLETEHSRTSEYSAATGDNKTVTAGAARTFTRTFLFPTEDFKIEVIPSENTYSQTMGVITRTAGTRNFSGGDVGKTITFLDSGLTALISGYTDATHVTTATSQTNAAQAISISTVVSKIGIPSTDNTYSRSGATVTRDAGSRDFSTNDIGKIIHFLTDAEEAIITAYTDATHVTVDTSGTLAAQNIKLYGFTDYTEVGFSHTEESGNNVNIRVLFSAPVRVYVSTLLQASQQLKLTYECRLTVSPSTATNGSLASIISDPGNLMSGNKSGKSAIETFATSLVLTDGSTDSNSAQLEPYFEGYAGLSLTNDALAPLTNKVRNSSTAFVPLVKAAYVPGAFENTYQALFGLNDAISNSWRSLMIYDPDSELSIFAFLYDAAQKKDGNHSFSISFKKTWGRDLS